MEIRDLDESSSDEEVEETKLKELPQPDGKSATGIPLYRCRKCQTLRRAQEWEHPKWKQHPQKYILKCRECNRRLTSQILQESQQ